MNSDAVMTPKPVPTSRRAVLRTGVRLAYAAPVVAASMALSAHAVEAQVSGPISGLLINCDCADRTGHTPCVQVAECSDTLGIIAACESACGGVGVAGWTCLPAATCTR